MSSNKYLYEVMGHKELLKSYKEAINDLPGSGPIYQQWADEAEAELLARLEGKKGITEITTPVKYRINQLEGEALTAAILNVEQYHEKREGVPPQNIAKSIWYAVNEGLQFDKYGKIWGR